MKHIILKVHVVLHSVLSHTSERVVGLQDIIIQNHACSLALIMIELYKLT